MYAVRRMRARFSRVERHTAELARQAEQLHAEMIDVLPEHTKAPITKHIEAWLTDLKRAGRSPEYTRKVEKRIKRTRNELWWAKLGSIQPDGVSR